MKQSELIQQLKEMVDSQLALAKEYASLTSHQLQWKQHDQRWNILECLEHLNLYGDFYLKTLEATILRASVVDEDKDYNPGWLGGFSAKSMLPKESGKLLYKMDTFKDKNPIELGLPAAPIDRFVKQQEHFHHLLDEAARIDLNKNRTPTTLPGMRFKLGDTLRFVIYHQERHVQQAQKTLSAQSS
jgi:hypothetical protein